MNETPSPAFDAGKRGPQPIYVVSDATGLTAEAVVAAAVGQFSGASFEVRRRAMTRSAEQVRATVVEAAQTHGVIVHTFVLPELRRCMEEETVRHGVPSVDVIGGLVARLEEAAGCAPVGQPGLRAPLDSSYFGRIEAIEYTVAHDDGQHPETLDAADVVLVGVSRTSKTPLSIFLSHFRGWKVANIPIVLGVEPPTSLARVDQRKVVGLTIQPERLVNPAPRPVRRPGTRPRRPIHQFRSGRGRVEVCPPHLSGRLSVADH